MGRCVQGELLLQDSSLLGGNRALLMGQACRRVVGCWSGKGMLLSYQVC